jgi:hypothetical protein
MMIILNYTIDNRYDPAVEGYYGVALDLYGNEIFTTADYYTTPAEAETAAKQMAREIIDSALRVARRELGGAA